MKGGDVRKSYAIKRRQPLLQFARCSGSHSDPMFQELEVAKEEYIHNNKFRIQKEQKVVLPKIVDLYAKDSSVGLMGTCILCLNVFKRASLPLFQKGRST